MTQKPAFWAAIVVATLALLTGIGYLLYQDRTLQLPAISPTPNQSYTAQGIITQVQQSSRPGIWFITLREVEDMAIVSVEINPRTRIISQENNRVEISELQRGFTVSVQGKPTEGAIEAESVTIQQSPNIVVLSPEPNQEIGRMFAVTGIARVFENTLQIRIRNTRTNTLYVSQTVMADAPDTGKYGEYSYSVSLGKNITDLIPEDFLTLEVFQYSAKDGSEIDKVVVPLRFAR